LTKPFGNITQNWVSFYHRAGTFPPAAAIAMTEQQHKTKEEGR